MAIRHLAVLAILSAGLFHAQPSKAEDFGLALKSCEDWTENVTDTGQGTPQNPYLYAGLTSWLEGYVSGVEDYASIASNDDVTTDTDGNGMIGWMDNYCESHPEDEIRKAVTIMLADFTKSGTIIFSKKQ